MKKMVLTAAAAATVVGAVAASAHPGASGAMGERMDGMGAMRDVVRSLTPMMRGDTAYDASAVVQGATVIEAHSGTAMTDLFPEGSNGAPSEARDAIWEEWEAFVELAERMEVMAVALAAAADNPPGSPMPGDGAPTSMMGGSAAMMSTEVMMGGVTAMPDADMFEQMPVDRVFAMVAQTCSACHTPYRAERD